VTGDQMAIVLAVAGFAAVVKSTTGFGYPLLLLPTLAQFTDVVDAVLIIVPSNLFLNLGIVWKLREQRSLAKTLKVFTTTGIVGAVIGTLLLPSVPVETFRLILLIVLVAFLFNRLSGLKFTMADETAYRFAPLVGGVAGITQGAAGVSGPLVTPWFLSVDTQRDTFIFSIASFFAVTQMGQVAVASIGQLFTTEILVVGLLIVPLGMISLPIGTYLRERISLEAFERVVIVLLSLVAISLVIRLF